MVRPAAADSGGNGKLSKRAGIPWSDTPVAVTYSRPYAVAVLPGHIEASFFSTSQYPFGLQQMLIVTADIHT